MLQVLAKPQTDVAGSGPSTGQDWLLELSRAGRGHGFRRASALAHNALNLGIFALVLGIAASAMAGVALAPSIAHAILGGIVIGWTTFALLILVVHEASHGMFVVLRDDARRRAANRAFGWVVAIPYGYNFRTQWEAGHVLHHRRPLDPNDPQQFNSLTGAALARRLALYLLVPGAVLLHRLLRKRARTGAIASTSSSGGIIKWSVLFWLALLVPLCAVSGGAPALAVLVSFQVAGALNEIKGSLEHGGALRAEADVRLRSRTSLFFGRWLIMPFNISLHFEHHLNPAVPWYRLGRYQREILPLVPPDLRPLLFNERPLAQLSGRLLGPSAALEARGSDPPASAGRVGRARRPTRARHAISDTPA